MVLSYPLQITLVKLIKLKRIQTVCTEKERKRDVGWWSNFILSPRKTGGFSEGLGTSRPRHRRVIQGIDTSSRPLTGTGA
jgi:hypothetical protein